MSYYLEASLLVSLVIEDGHSNAAEAWWRMRPRPVIISDFAATEVAATLSRGVRARRFSEAQAAMALEDLDSLRGQADEYRPDHAAFNLADEYVRDFAAKLAAPDALHLASARCLGAELVTFDGRLAEAGAMKGVAIADIA